MWVGGTFQSDTIYLSFYIFLIIKHTIERSLAITVKMGFLTSESIFIACNVYLSITHVKPDFGVWADITSDDLIIIVLLDLITICPYLTKLTKFPHIWLGAKAHYMPYIFSDCCINYFYSLQRAYE